LSNDSEADSADDYKKMKA